MTFFHNYPILASLVVLVAALVVGTIELEMTNLKPAAWFTWFIGGLALIAPLGGSSYPTRVKSLCRWRRFSPKLPAGRWPKDVSSSGPKNVPMHSI
jgi:hypothetical protein